MEGFGELFGGLGEIFGGVSEAAKDGVKIAAGAAAAATGAQRGVRDAGTPPVHERVLTGRRRALNVNDV
jgi:hypothetical protein